MRSLHYLAAALSVVALTACAGPQTTGTYQAHAPYNRVFAAARDAVPIVGYTVTSASNADGLIVAQQGVMLGHGSTVGMSVAVTDMGTQSGLFVTFTAPPNSLALGNFDENLTKYISAVRVRVPELVAVTQ